MLFNRKAQSTAEYAIIIGVVVGAIMAVGVFLRGGIEAKVRDMTSQYIGNVVLNTSTAILASDYNTTSNSSVQTKSNTSSATEIIAGGGTLSNLTGADKTQRTGKTTYFGQ
jgi:uncharacterized protein (UPF0333 family)